jgi:hypothetical protein
MIIIKKKNVYPIIIPTAIYTDRFQYINSFIDMNPSLNIDNDGNITILVRSVNYRTNSERLNLTYGHDAESHYSIITCKITDDFSLDNMECNKLCVDFDVERYKTWWYGLEDIRFIDNETILACIPECNPNEGNPCIFKCKLNGNTVSSFVKCEPSKIEKNWMPYYCNIENKYKVIYNICPFIIKTIEENINEEINLEDIQREELNGWHGSSNGIDYNGEKLFLIHKTLNNININKWLLFNPVTKSIRYSKSFMFFKYSYIEFVCSLIEYKGNIFVGLGVNDNKSFIVELDKEEIKKMLY